MPPRSLAPARRRLARRGALLLVPLAIALAGCGGSNDGGGAADAATAATGGGDPAAYAAGAEAACREAERALAETSVTVGRAAAEKKRILADRLAALSALSPPSDLADAHSRAVAAARAQLDAQERVLQAVGGEGTPDVAVAPTLVPEDVAEAYRDADAAAAASLREVAGPECALALDRRAAGTAFLGFAALVRQVRDTPSAQRPGRSGELLPEVRAVAEDLRLAGGRMSGYEVDDPERDAGRVQMAAAAPVLADVEVEFFETVRDGAPGDRVLAKLGDATERVSSALEATKDD